jgi:TolA-binding protein
MVRALVVVAAVALCVGAGYLLRGAPEPDPALVERLDKLEKRVAQLEARPAASRPEASPPAPTASLAQDLAAVKQQLDEARAQGKKGEEAYQRLEQEKQSSEEAAQRQKRVQEIARAAYEKHRSEDVLHYGADEAARLEKRYREATAGAQWNEEELQKILESYPDSNWAGCSQLFLAESRMRQHQNADAEALLKSATTRFPDAMCNESAQVGVYAQFKLVSLYGQSHREDDAARLASQLMSRYPDALDWDGAPLRGKLARYAERAR